MNGTNAKNSILVVIVHGFVVLAITLAPLPRASAAGPAAATGPRSTGSIAPSGVPEGLTTAEWDAMQRLIRQAEYQLTWHEPSNAYTGPNRASGIWLAFGPGEVQVRSGDPAETWAWSLALTGYGTPGAVGLVTGTPVLAVDANRAEYRWDGTLTEWYVNDEHGLEQGFNIAAPPAGTESGVQRGGALTSQIVLEMALHTDLAPQLAADAQSITFRGPSQPGWQGSTEILRYDSLRVSDRIGRQLPAHLRLSGCSQPSTCRVQLVIDATFASYPLTVDPLLHSQVAKLTASDAEDVDYFGTSVAVSGDTVVVGAPNEDGAGSDRGAAYVYARNSGGGDNWGQVKKLTASDAEDGDWFGTSVAISGDTIVVGADWEDGAGSDRGAAYIYVRNNGGPDNWGQVKKLTASDAEDSDWFGTSVAISGDTVVVGAHLEGGAGNARGAVYVYTRNNGGPDNWGQVKKLTTFDAQDNDYLGVSVAISGDTAVAGASGEDGAGMGFGAAYVYARNSGGPDNWGQVKKLTASDAEHFDIFGISVAISGDAVVVGAYYEAGAGTNRGAAYVYARNCGGPDNWGQVKKLSASDAQDNDWFGYSAAISGDTVIVGAYHEGGAGSNRGAVYVYARNNGGADNWGEVEKLTASDAEDDDHLGGSVAISGGTVVIGASGEDGAGTVRGAAYVFIIGPYSVYLPLVLRSYGTP